MHVLKRAIYRWLATRIAFHSMKLDHWLCAPSVRRGSHGGSVSLLIRGKVSGAYLWSVDQSSPSPLEASTSGAAMMDHWTPIKAMTLRGTLWRVSHMTAYLCAESVTWQLTNASIHLFLLLLPLFFLVFSPPHFFLPHFFSSPFLQTTIQVVQCCCKS